MSPVIKKPQHRGKAPFLSVLAAYLAAEEGREACLLANAAGERIEPEDLVQAFGGDRAGAYILQPSGPLTVGMGQAVSFQGDTDFGTTFLWSFGDGATATTQTASHAFSAVGTYTVSFKASANGYLASTTTVTITVIAKPSLTSFTASPASISSGQSSTLAWAVTGATSLCNDPAKPAPGSALFSGSIGHPTH